MRIFLVLATLATGCSAVRPVLTSHEPRIWVVRGNDEVLRCADAAQPDQPPKPVCIPAGILANQ